MEQAFDFVVILGDIFFRVLFLGAAVMLTVNTIKKLKTGSNSVHYSKGVSIFIMVIGDILLIYLVFRGFKGSGTIGRLWTGTTGF